MKLSVQTLRSRNPLVALTLFRKAGSHRPSVKTERRLADGALRRELAELVKPSP